jgi:hypothetical protein
MAEAESYFLQLCSELKDGKAGKMFGLPCIKAANGKAAAMLWKDNLVVKLQGDMLNEALSLDGSKPFEPMEGRPMKEWVAIPVEYKREWKRFALSSLESVKKLKK